MSEFFKITRAGELSTLAFARTQGLNILSAPVLKDLSEAWTKLEKDGTRVVLFYGEGKVFLAGADIKEMAALNPQGAMDCATRGQQIFQRIENSPLISIVAMHGAALGGGCELALACDIRLASEDLKIGLPETGLGLVPGFGGTQRLPRVVGTGRALRMILTSEVLTAQLALQAGLVTDVYPAELLLPAAHKLAETILAKGPQATVMAKHLVREALDKRIDEGCEKERKSFYRAFQSNEAQEGLRAFIEKRAPNFQRPKASGMLPAQ